MRQKCLDLFTQFESKLSDNIHTRTMIAIQLFDFLDILKEQEFPANWFEQLEYCLNKHIEIDEFTQSYFDHSKNSYELFYKEHTETSVEKVTGEVYYNLWKEFSKDEYYQQAKTYLEERFQKNNVSIKGKKQILDDGCGSGRYSLALKSMGCQQVTGIDISQNSISFANKMNSFGNEVKFQQGSVLELPFENEQFDFVYSNGVLHHTLDTYQGLQEIFRVLQPGGSMWLYLYGGKESLFWDLTDLCRNILKNIPQKYTQDVMIQLGYPSGRVFHRLDFFYVPMHRRYSTLEVEQMLSDAGFESWKKLNRGVDFDWDEIKYKYPHIDPYIYGEGEMRYWVEK